MARIEDLLSPPDPEFARAWSPEDYVGHYVGPDAASWNALNQTPPEVRAVVKERALDPILEHKALKKVGLEALEFLAPSTVDWWRGKKPDAYEVPQTATKRDLKGLPKQEPFIDPMHAIIAAELAGLVIPTPMGPARKVAGKAQKLADALSTKTDDAVNLLGKGDVGAGLSDDVVKPLGKEPRRTSASLKDLRKMSVKKAIEEARKDPHLIPSPDGGYVGGPANIKTYEDVLAQRAKMDANLAGRSEYAEGLERAGFSGSNVSKEDPAAARWYARARKNNMALSQDPRNPAQQVWNARITGEHSPGAQPIVETGMATGARNSAIAEDIRPVFNPDGTPKLFTDRIDRPPAPGAPQELSGVRQTARPLNAQHVARAVLANDPDILSTGLKTREYADFMIPHMAKRKATGVTDFRWLNELGFTNPDGSAQSAGNHLTGAANHRWSDNETALAADRANKARLHGRRNWTGEEIQALGWVRQKAGDLQRDAGGKPVSVSHWGLHDQPNMTWDEAMVLANKTPFDFAERNTFNAIHENMSGLSGHLPELPHRPQAVQDAYSNKAWWTDENNKDIFYGALHARTAPDARMLMRETVPAQGVWKADDGSIQYNAANVARPVISYKVGGGEIAEPDVRMIRAVEGSRGLIDAQSMTGGHVVIPESQAKAGEMGSIRVPTGKALTKQEAQDLTTIGAKYGRPHISDTGTDVTMTDWFNQLSGKEAGKILRKGHLATDLANALSVTGPIERAKIQSVMFKFPPSEVGSGARTRAVLDEVSQSPNIYRALNESTKIPKKALANLLRDREYLKNYPDRFRKDQMRLLEIVSEGPGWLDRLKDAVKKGGIVPVALLGVLGAEEIRQ